MPSPAPPAAYGLGIRAYGAVIRLASAWRRDARRWVQARNAEAHRFERVLAGLSPAGETPRVWMHCASLGEYEQGLPLLEAVLEDLARASGKSVQGVISFFSPSGLDVVAARPPRLPHPVCLVYLPLDMPDRARAFAQTLQADIGLVVKYEFWLNHLFEAECTGTRLHLVSARFRDDQVFFGPDWKPWTKWFRDGLTRFAGIHCQDHASVERVLGALERAARAHKVGTLASAGPAADDGRNTVVQRSGDTRFDRVLQRAAVPQDDAVLEAFARQGPLLVAGSTWLPDDRLLGELVQNLLAPRGWRLLVAPHHVDADHIQTVRACYPESTRLYSAFSQEDLADLEQVPVLIVDRIGLLAQAYRLGQLAYIGGGFGAGIHNTLEAAVYGLPLAFGPRWQKFAEARELLDCGAARQTADAAELQAWAERMLDGAGRSADGERAARAAADYVRHRAGAVARIRSVVLRDWEAHRASTPSAKA